MEESKVINWTSSWGETSFVRNEDHDDEEHIFNDGDKDKNVDIGQDNIQNSMQLILILVKVETKKIVVALHKKRQQVRSTKRALSQVANSL